MGLLDRIAPRVTRLRAGEVYEGERAYITERERVPWPGTYALDGDNPIARLEYDRELGLFVVAEVI